MLIRIRFTVKLENKAMLLAIPVAMDGRMWCKVQVCQLLYLIVATIYE